MSDNRESYKQALDRITESEGFREETARKMKEAWQKRQEAPLVVETKKQNTMEAFEISMEEITATKSRSKRGFAGSFFKAFSAVAAVLLCGVILLSALRAATLKEAERGTEETIATQITPGTEPDAALSLTQQPEATHGATNQAEKPEDSQEGITLDSERNGYYRLYEEIEELVGLPADEAGAFIYGSERCYRENGVEYEYLSVENPNEEIALYFRNSFDAKDTEKEVLLLANGTIRQLKGWSYRLDSGMPYVSYEDYNQDGKKELAVIFTAEEERSGEEFMELHILSPNTTQEYVWEACMPDYTDDIMPMYIKLYRGDAATYIFLSVSESEDEAYYVFAAEKDTMLDEADFEDVCFGNQVQIYSQDKKLFTRYPVYVINREYEVGFVTAELVWNEAEQKFAEAAPQFVAESDARLDRAQCESPFFNSATSKETVLVQLMEYEENTDGIYCTNVRNAQKEAYLLAAELLAFWEEDGSIQRADKNGFLEYLEDAGMDGTYRLYLYNGIVYMIERTADIR